MEIVAAITTKNSEHKDIVAAITTKNSEHKDIRYDKMLDSHIELLY